jgi:tetratricopeptide (TPR) repeat protein
MSFFILPQFIHADLERTIAIGSKYINRFEFEQAIQHFKTAIESDDRNEVVYYYLGEAIRLRIFWSRFREFTETKEASLVEEAKNAYQSSLELNPHFLDSRIGLGRLYRRNGENDKALEQYELLEKNGMDSSDLYKEIGPTYLDKNNAVIAKEYFIKAGINANDEFALGNRFETVLKIEFNIKDRLVRTKSFLIWEITEPIIFNAKAGDKKFAESIIRDMISANLYDQLSIVYSAPREKHHVDKIYIVERCNSALDKFGLKLFEIQNVV